MAIQPVEPFSIKDTVMLIYTVAQLSQFELM